MKRYLPALALLIATLATGCQPATVTTPAAPPAAPPAADRNNDVHIRTPRVDVDVERKDRGTSKRSVEVNVNPTGK
ncbi:hypothetical protein [Gemmata sp.]|uniref:hypothetical protein n=1 Tax=Gemmata sp. TaxID=1914242 RepID=UPI003F700088